ncbi:MAG TPA: hypothetical protein VF638_01000 [Sphingomonas sp.]|jgi:hypothetical protein
MIYADWRSAFSAVLDPRLYTIEWLDRQIATGAAHFMASDNAAIITEFRQYPTGAKDIHGLIAAGDLEEIVHILIPAAEHLAVQTGCVGAIIESRAGWGKVLQQSGYQPYQIALRKEF